MCGICCMITDKTNGFDYKDVEIFELLVYMDTLRGEDSTGVFLVDNLGNVAMAKAAIDGPEFLKTKEWKDLKDYAIKQGWALVAHNRKATRGSITDENAHPFCVDDQVVLVHNGSFLGSHKHLADVEVDSHAIAHLLAREENMQAAFDQINAAYALVWYNVEARAMHIVRNSQRPLHWYEHNRTKFFTSEKSILSFALHRCVTTVNTAKLYELATNKINIWELQDDKTSTSHVIQLDEKVVEHVYGPWWQKEESPKSRVIRPFPEYLKEYLDSPEFGIYGWQEEVSYGKHSALREGSFSEGTRIKVEVVDFYQTDDNCIFVGKLIPYNGHIPEVAVVFTVDRVEFDNALECSDFDYTYYYVTIEDQHWETSVESDRADLVRGHIYLAAHTPTRVVINSQKALQ